jgi:hypothetical protein
MTDSDFAHGYTADVTVLAEKFTRLNRVLESGDGLVIQHSMAAAEPYETLRSRPWACFSRPSAATAGWRAGGGGTASILR